MKMTEEDDEEIVTGLLTFYHFLSLSVRGTVDGGAKLAGDPKLNIFTE